MNTEKKSILKTLFPFLRWFPLTQEKMRADLVAGITVALILVPQSMAYAQLAGLPVVYGLYASLLPVVIGSMWGSSNQLHTGPVAMLALISAVTIVPFATPGSDKFIELSLMLALMVGVLRLILGFLRLGAMVNLLSSPVVVGFTNAAALIIGLSLLAEVLNVPFPRSDVFMADLWRVVAQIGQAHWPTIGFALATAAIMLGLRRFLPRIPGILVAVVITTLASWAIGFERNQSVQVSAVGSPQAQTEILMYAETEKQVKALTIQLSDINQHLRELKKSVDSEEVESGLNAQADLARRKIIKLKADNNQRRVELHAIKFKRIEQADGTYMFMADRQEGKSNWRFGKIKDGQIVFTGGGRVVGNIPVGLPTFSVPHIHWDLFMALLPGALVMALIGFLEATSISKAISAMTREKINPSRELIGQGLANIVGSFFHSFVVSGSFSRSAVAARMGARTGMFAIVSALAVALVLMFFTSLLYHLPLAVLAVIVMLSVFDLIKTRPLFVAWKVDKLGALTGVITFVATLAMAPAIANGVLIGVGLTVLLLLVRQMKPRAVMLGQLPDGRLSDMKEHALAPFSTHFATVRYDGSLDFLNAAHFEEVILRAHAEFPDAKMILVIGNGINSIDASGEEKIREIAEYMKKANVSLAFSSLKQPVREKFERAGLPDLLGEENIFKSRETAFQALQSRFSGIPAAG
ncbi:SulP family inorganic anion transporter [Sulfurirhabdus autotrophica]|uniref:STAS domain-containing protein n=1 Tax=Sulfurirhabdus autotrophica TaxID=1706046 RepID=A0A4R3YEJ5_9PROT|nr:SulP family inorganic anion transporter [Sulfurirhabdus autotrophica]TCV89588.1 STAS domain-containing protein [Sulfurirhabdus autotrophica]